MAIHFLTAVRKYQTLESISRRLQIPSSVARDILKGLEGMSVLKEENGQFRFLSGEYHLGNDAPQVVMHHANWRNRALLDAQRFQSDGVHYSSVYAMSENDFEKLKGELIHFIERTRSVMNLSSEEEVFCFNCDWFRI